MDPEGLLTELVDEVLRLGAVFLAEGDELAGAIGTTAAGWRVLGRLAKEPGTVAEIARARGLRRQSVRETVERLERDGLVERVPNAADRRAPLVRLTGGGADAVRAIEPARAAWAHSRARGVDPGDLATTVAVLRRLRGD